PRKTARRAPRSKRRCRASSSWWRSGSSPECPTTSANGSLRRPPFRFLLPGPAAIPRIWDLLLALHALSRAAGHSPLHVLAGDPLRSPQRPLRRILVSALITFGSRLSRHSRKSSPQLGLGNGEPSWTRSHQPDLLDEAGDDLPLDRPGEPLPDLVLMCESCSSHADGREISE